MLAISESRIILSHCTTYLASSLKSDAAYMAISGAMAAVQTAGDLPVPLHLRNAPAQLMKRTSITEKVTSIHTAMNFSRQEYLPDASSG